MAGGIDWFRWHHGSVTDPKFQLVARRSGASLPDVLAVWAYVLEQASADKDRGHIGDVDAEALDCLFGFPNTETRTADILKAMRDRGLIEGNHVAAWEKRQPKREREDDGAANRKRAQRARAAAEGSQSEPFSADDNHVTPCHATSRQKSPRGEERREEKKNSPSLRSGEGRASRLPKPFDLPDEYRDFCRQERPDLDPDAVAAKFADYWHGKPGKAGTKLDWLATWRNWVREERVARPATTSAPAEPAWRAEQRERTQIAAPGVAAHREPAADFFDGQTIDAPLRRLN